MSTQIPDLIFPIKEQEGETFEDNLTDNARYNIIPERYAMKDADGNPVETPNDTVERVAKNVAVAEAVHFDEEVEIRHKHIKPDHPRRDDLIEKVFGSDVDTTDTVLDVTELNEDNAKWVSYDELVPDLEGDVERVVTATKDEFHEIMSELSFTPNSPTWMNAGDELQQLSACFVNTPEDSMDNIYQTVKDASLVMQSGGGMGYAFSYLRPYGDIVGSSGGIASGPITFMRSFDQMCRTIAQGGTRRGAQMGVMRCTHPDLPFFIHAKNEDVSLVHALMLDDPKDPENLDFGEALEEARDILDQYDGVPKMFRNAVEAHLSNFNISVTVTNEFMEAVKNDDEHTFINPRTGEPHIATEHTEDLYSWFGLGEYVTEGEVLSVPARELFERMAKGAHENGEPGILFIDKANEDHSFPTESTPEYSADSYEMHTTNPCGEQWLMENEACNLGHVNLSTVVDEDATPWTEWAGTNVLYEMENGTEQFANLEEDVSDFLDQAIDWSDLKQRVNIGTRFLDNVVTMSNFEFGEDFQFTDIEETVRDNRKVGLGIMGLAQMFIQIGVRYGDEVSEEVARQLQRRINQQSKEASKELALERGKFNNWDDSKYANPTEHAEWFERQTGEDADEWEDGFPMRNHNTTTVAPTGTTSMVGNTSSGCEPIYNVAFFKNVGQDVQGDEMLVEFDDYFLRALDANGIDREEVKEEATRQMANNEYKGIAGLPSVPDELGELFVTTGELSGLEHAGVQAALQEGVDSAISKTVNFPNEATVEDVEEVLLDLFDSPAKGATIYRDGSRSKQVITTRQDNRIDDAEDLDDETVQELAEERGLLEADSSVGAEPKKRPKELVGTTEKINTGYGTLYLTVNQDPNGDPFEVFANIGKSGGYTQSWTEATARLVSLSLRAGVNPERVVEQLDGIRAPDINFDQGEQVRSVPDGVAKGLHRAITEDGETEEAVTGGTKEIVSNGENPECPDCGSMLKVEEGCQKCSSKSCGWSKC